VLLTKITGLRITQDRKIKQNKMTKYLPEKSVTFRSSTGMLQGLFLLTDSVIKNKLRKGKEDLIKYRLKTRSGYFMNEKSIGPY